MGNILPYLSEKNKSITLIDSFGGVNKRFKINENEFSDIYNMCADDYPVLSTRKKRTVSILLNEGEKLGLPAVYGDISSVVVVNDCLAILTVDGIFSYKNKKLNLNIPNNKMLRFGNRIYCYPSGTVINLPKNENDEVTVEVTHQFVEVSTPAEGETADGTIDERGKTLGLILMQPSVPEAVGKTVCSFTAPENPDVGDYWLNAAESSELKRYCGEDTGWESVVPSLIRLTVIEFKSSDTDESEEYEYTDVDLINIPWLWKNFSVGDALFVSNTESELDSSYIVEAVGNEEDPSIYLSGYVDTWQLFGSGRIERKMPVIDFVTEHNGRLWGCRYGENSEGDIVNEIYASALNNPTNWFKFNGTSQDSYALSVMSEGKFTGVGIINGYVTFFKETCMHRIYGYSPEDFQLYTVSCIGVQEGSEQSIATLNGVTYYKSSSGIMAISDGLPVRISDALGIDCYSDALGGTDGSKYYVSMLDSDGERRLYVYSADSCIWHTENSPNNLKTFFSYKNNLFAVCYAECDEDIDDQIAKYEAIRDSEDTGYIAKYMARLMIAVLKLSKNGCSIYGLRGVGKIAMPSVMLEVDENADDVEVPLVSQNEDDFCWSFETGDIGFSRYYKKYVSKIFVRLLVMPSARVDIEIKYDFSSEWQTVANITGEGSIRTVNMPVHPARCDTFRLRFSGFGDIKLLNIAEFFEEGSEE